MKKINTLPIIALLILIIPSCVDTQPGQGMRPNVSGASGEVVIVIDKAKWDGPLGQAFRDVFSSPLDGLPQAEPRFTLANISPSGFGNLYQTHRNVIFLSTGPDKEPKITSLSDTYAFTQLMLNLEARDDEALIKLLYDQQDAIIEKINIAERDRWISYYKQSINSVNFNNLREKHKLTLHIPGNYVMSVDEEGFVWMSYETPVSTQSVLVHYFDYNGENYFNEDSIISIRNNMTKAKVPGPVEGTWMTIEDQVPVKYRTFRFRDRNYAEMKGLWTLEYGFMGGPFVSLITKDEVNNRFVMIDGFVYAPKEDKRELLRQVEAILYTIDFDNEEEVVITPSRSSRRKNN